MCVFVFFVSVLLSFARLLGQIYAEKGFTASVEEADAVVDACAKNGVFLNLASSQPIIRWIYPAPEHTCCY